MSLRRLEDVLSVTIFRLPRCLQNGLQDVSVRLQDVLKTFLEDVLEDVKLLR